ncbi:putative serine/threonine-protein phosphatase 6 regulatory ankyrin repeat subunit B [Paratrimastix pyriformis]|uniref:Serine/threonine-protein phosphatase 6 regulatory ankyrin repeat subunit B n=1 Tax=Paratrimastix pyriformis TaxID=342808 RepID=A0ABQ8UGH7_9EUKA|nr:putative serine/threonine-protein phosphatase 6 regulatory ankyrin repeat subunit B [Paratrimastix pyriformis]
MMEQQTPPRGLADCLRQVLALAGCFPDISAAFQNGDLEFLRSILDGGFPLEIREPTANQTLLHMACQSGHIALVAELLARGADLEATFTGGGRALHLACLHNHSDLVEFLITQGAEIDACDQAGCTPLHRTAMAGLVDVTRVLLAHGAQVDIADRSGWRPLLLAATHGHAEVAGMLIDRGALLEPPFQKGLTPLALAAMGGHTATLQVLLGRGAPIERPIAGGSTPLHLAARHGHKEALAVLLQAGADPEAADCDGSTPLHMAARKGHMEAARVLIRNGASVTATTKGGLTPLHVACGAGVPAPLVALLLQAGASPEALDNNGYRPLDHAAPAARPQLGALFTVSDLSTRSRAAAPPPLLPPAHAVSRPSSSPVYQATAGSHGVGAPGRPVTALVAGRAIGVAAGQEADHTDAVAAATTRDASNDGDNAVGGGGLPGAGGVTRLAPVSTARMSPLKTATPPRRVRLTSDTFTPPPQLQPQQPEAAPAPTTPQIPRSTQLAPAAGLPAVSGLPRPAAATPATPMVASTPAMVASTPATSPPAMTTRPAAVAFTPATATVASTPMVAPTPYMTTMPPETIPSPGSAPPPPPLLLAAIPQDVTALSEASWALIRRILQQWVGLLWLAHRDSAAPAPTTTEQLLATLLGALQASSLPGPPQDQAAAKDQLSITIPLPKLASPPVNDDERPLSQGPRSGGGDEDVPSHADLLAEAERYMARAKSPTLRIQLAPGPAGSPAAGGSLRRGQLLLGGGRR